MRSLIIGIVGVAAGFAWGFAAEKYHIFPHSIAAAAVEYKDPRIEARRAYLATRSEPAKVVFLGDSIFQSVEWAEEIPGAVNRGISGDSTKEVLARLDTLPAAKTYVIQLGTNDLGNGSTPESAAANIQRIVDALPGEKIVMSVTPCDTTYGDCRPADIDALNTHLASIKGARFVQSHLDPATDLADKVHPNASGIRKLVAAVRPQIKG